jgi:hypothetical protein
MRDQDWKSRQPRTYSDTNSLYPSIHSNPDSTSSHSAAAATMPRTSSHSPAREPESSIKREESSPRNRKRKLSWPPRSSGTEATHQEHGEEKQEVLMRPMSSSTASNSERLPGIAHLDEQMHTPWSVGHARRTAGLRGSTGDDSLRRLSSNTFPYESRSWRSSLPDSASPASRGELLPHLPPYSIRRASSPGHGDFNRSQHLAYQGHYQERPSNSPGGSRRSPSDHELSHRPRPSEEHDPRRPPSRDDRHHQAAFAPYDSRDEPYSYSQDRRTLEHAPDHAQYRYHRDTDMAHSQSSYSHHGNEAGYGHRMYDRDSPSYFDEAREPGGQQRMEGGSYASSGANTSPNVPRRRGKLPKVVTDLLKAWLLDHASHPYPTEDEKRRLCSVTGLSISQVSNWFINARRRILVPQGSGNFALGQSSSAPHSGHGHPPTPPQHHLAPPPQHHHAPSPHHHHQQYHQSQSFRDEGKHSMYRTAASHSRSHSPDPRQPPHSRRSFDEPR